MLDWDVLVSLDLTKKQSGKLFVKVHVALFTNKELVKKNVTVVAFSPFITSEKD